MICAICKTDTPPTLDRCVKCSAPLSLSTASESMSQAATMVPSSQPRSSTASARSGAPSTAVASPTPDASNMATMAPGSVTGAGQGTMASWSGTGAGQGTLPPGSMFGRYHIIRLLGSGGMGHVYHAWDGELGEAVALKVIRGEYLSSQEAEARFKRELSVARQVTHKNVIRIFDLGTFEGTKYISMA